MLLAEFDPMKLSPLTGIELEQHRTRLEQYRDGPQDVTYPQKIESILTGHDGSLCRGGVHAAGIGVEREGSIALATPGLFLS